MRALLSCLTVWVCTTAVGAEDAPFRTTLAEYVDVQARLYVEVREGRRLRGSPAGEALGAVISALVAEVRVPPATQPPAAGPALTPVDPAVETFLPSAAQPQDIPESWQMRFARAMGLEDEQAARRLLDGRFAVAADGLHALSGAIFVARPEQVDALEAILAPRLIATTRNLPLRRYALDRHHELACDGRTVLIGAAGQESDLYRRTLRMLESGQGVALADLAEFRDRMAEIRTDSQIFLFASRHRRAGGADPSPGLGWLLMSPAAPRSLALGLWLGARGIQVEIVGRLAGESAPPRPRDPPIESLLFLPAETIAAWTQPINYLEKYREIARGGPTEVSRIILELLEWQLPEGGLERNLCAHLCEDSVLILGQVPQRRTPPHHGRQPRIPTLSLLVETRQPAAVDATLLQVARNAARLINDRPEAGREIRISEQMVDSRGTVVRWIALDRLLPPGLPPALTAGAVEFSWVVDDRWLIVGTHHASVREIVLARRGEVPLMPTEAVQAAMSRDQPPRRVPDSVLVAQPGLAAAAIDSWLAYLRENHPDMFEARWWRQIRQRYMASQVQLGVIPAPLSAPGEVEVAATLANYPAWGRLEAGDRIVAVDGRRLAPAQTLQSLRDALATREREDLVVLTVIRSESECEVEIPMTASGFPAGHVQPLSLLQRVSELARHFAFASYTMWQSGRDTLRTRLQLRLAGPTQPRRTDPAPSPLGIMTP